MVVSDRPKAQVVSCGRFGTISGILSEGKLKYIYGPVQSRRLGSSLGISTVPYKECPFDCVYCQLNRTVTRTVKRRSTVDEGALLRELKDFWKHKPPATHVDCVTFSGSGEPTLHVGIGRLIRAAKEITGVPAVVITNSAFLTQEKVRRDLLEADIVVPSLDAVTQEVFEKIDRPAKGIMIEAIIEGLERFRREFTGVIWLEVMLVRGINDAPAYLKEMNAAIGRIRPDRVQLNSPVRPPAHPWVKPVSHSVLREACRILGPSCEIV